MARVHALIGESLMDDPENQIKGPFDRFTNVQFGTVCV